jgi:hypothetical protein
VPVTIGKMYWFPCPLEKVSTHVAYVARTVAGYDANADSDALIFGTATTTYAPLPRTKGLEEENFFGPHELDVDGDVAVVPDAPLELEDVHPAKTTAPNAKAQTETP